MRPKVIRRVQPSELGNQVAQLRRRRFRFALLADRTEDVDSRLVYLFLDTSLSSDVELHVPYSKATAVDLSQVSLAGVRWERDIRRLRANPETELASPRQRRFPEFNAGLTRRQPARLRFVPSLQSDLPTKLTQRIAGQLAGVVPGNEAEDPGAQGEETHIGQAIAFCGAVEDALGLYVPEVVERMRAILLELERLYHHVDALGTLGRIIGDDALAHEACGLLEILRRVNVETTGDHLLRGSVVIAGATLRTIPNIDSLLPIGRRLRERVESTLQGGPATRHLAGSVVLTHDEAVAVGALGYVARASGVNIDARRDHDSEILGEFGLRLSDILTIPTYSDGDIAARFLQRAGEMSASLEVLDTLMRATNPGQVAAWPSMAYRSPAPAGAVGVGVSEGWHGTIVCRVEISKYLRLRHVAIADPRRFNAAALDMVLARSQGADIELAKHSFDIPGFYQAHE
jgi:Ni,Fe-hydrogenase III large subunit